MTKHAIGLLSFCAACAIAPLASAGAAVDLNAPGAIESLARRNPEHYAKIEKILADVARQPQEAVAQWMKAEFGAEDVSFPQLLMTSDPPKRNLSFALDKTRYEVVVQVPTRWSFAPR